MKLYASLDPRIKQELVKQKSTITAGLVCTVVASALGNTIPAFAKWVVKSVQQGEWQNLTWIAIGVVVVFLLKFIFTRQQAVLLGKAAARITADLRIRLFSKLQRLPVSYYNEKRAGSIQSVLTNDVGVFQAAIGLVKDSVDGPVNIVAGLALVLYFQWQIAVLVLIAFPFFAAVSRVNARRVHRAQRVVQDNLGALNAMMQEALQGARVIKAFGAEDRMCERVGTLNDGALSSQIRAIRVQALLRPSVELLGACVLALVVFLIAKTSLGHTLTTDNLLASLLALDRINQGQRSLGSFQQVSSQVRAASDRLYEEILDIPEDEPEKADLARLPSPCGRVEFEKVSFTYPDGTVALTNVSFTIEPGESLALVGHSGSGKSTVADLLLRFYKPTCGRILFDGIDVLKLDPDWLRSQMGVVPQHSFLFAGTVADNIRMGRQGATDAEVKAAAKAAHVDVFVEPTPLGYDTELGERGVRMSGGEIQRIAIARALIRKPVVLVLDEATSALDAISEKRVQAELDEAISQRTTLLIAHRLTTAARATRILVLRSGQVAEIGSHGELMAANGSYAAMVRAFGGGALEAQLN